jgi:hypothetical protein
MPRVLITDKLRSYAAAKPGIMPGVEHLQQKGLDNRAENSHQPTRRRERIMKRFKSPRQGQRFLSTHDQIANVFACRPTKIPSPSFVIARGQALPPRPRPPVQRWPQNHACRRPPFNPPCPPLFQRRQVDGAEPLDAVGSGETSTTGGIWESDHPRCN